MRDVEENVCARGCIACDNCSVASLNSCIFDACNVRVRVRASAHGPDSQIPKNRTIAWEERRRAQLCQLDISRVTRRSNGGVSEYVCCWCSSTSAPLLRDAHHAVTTVCSFRSTDNTQCVYMQTHL
jgi:hypothetical protein